jgi:hypothetical protein
MMIDAVYMPGQQEIVQPRSMRPVNALTVVRGRAEKAYDASLYATVSPFSTRHQQPLWEPLKDNSSDGWRPRQWPNQSRIRTPR